MLCLNVKSSSRLCQERLTHFGLLPNPPWVVNRILTTSSLCRRRRTLNAMTRASTRPNNMPMIPTISSTESLPLCLLYSPKTYILLAPRQEKIWTVLPQTGGVSPGQKPLCGGRSLPKETAGRDKRFPLLPPGAAVPCPAPGYTDAGDPA